MANETPKIKLKIGDAVAEKNLTNAEFAKAAGLTHAQALALIRGNVSMIAFKTLERVCDVVDREPGDLLVREAMQ
jgi:DNA-binding Xre family transcriptional regulator